MSRRRFRGVIREGRYEHCGVVPQCMGMANGTPEQTWQCTCPVFSVTEIEFAERHRLTFVEEGDLPIEWQRARWRYDRPIGPIGGKEDDFCDLCGRDADVVRVGDERLCERCVRLALEVFTRDRPVAAVQEER